MHLSKDFFNFSTRPKPPVVKLPMLEKYIYSQVKDFNFKRAFFEKKPLPPPLDIFLWQFTIKTEQQTIFLRLLQVFVLIYSLISWDFPHLSSQE